MAKGKSTGSNAYGTPPSLTSLLSPSLPPAIVDPVILKQLTTVRNYEYPLRPRQLVTQDLRYYHPAKAIRAAPALIRSATRLVVRPHKRVLKAITPKTIYEPTNDLSHAIGFHRPNLVGICVRRKIRREVLHALHRTNRGRGGGHRRRNAWSGIKC